MFKEWEQKARKKFMFQGELLPPQMRHMIAYNGCCDDATCGTCIFLDTVKKKGKVAFECNQSPGSKTGKGNNHFQPGWPACGLYKPFGQKENK